MKCLFFEFIRIAHDKYLHFSHFSIQHDAKSLWLMTEYTKRALFAFGLQSTCRALAATLSLTLQTFWDLCAPRLAKSTMERFVQLKDSLTVCFLDRSWPKDSAYINMTMVDNFRGKDWRLCINIIFLYGIRKLQDNLG